MKITHKMRTISNCTLLTLVAKCNHDGVHRFDGLFVHNQYNPQICKRCLVQHQFIRQFTDLSSQQNHQFNFIISFHRSSITVGGTDFHSAHIHTIDCGCCSDRLLITRLCSKKNCGKPKALANEIQHAKYQKYSIST